jgi:hypothetical protein
LFFFINIPLLFLLVAPVMNLFIELAYQKLSE